MQNDVAVAAAAATLTAAAPTLTTPVVAASATARTTGKSHVRSADGEAKYKEAKKLRKRAKRAAGVAGKDEGEEVGAVGGGAAVGGEDDRAALVERLAAAEARAKKLEKDVRRERGRLQCRRRAVV